MPDRSRPRTSCGIGVGSVGVTGPGDATGAVAGAGGVGDGGDGGDEDGGDDDEGDDAASALMIMTLGAEKGTSVIVTSDDDAAVEEIAGLIEKDLDA